MGLGPREHSLLERIGFVPRTLDWLEMERMERGLTRRAAVIKWKGKGKKVKPLAPVANSARIEGERLWQWVGESVESKGLFNSMWYKADMIRAVGFKLPPIGGKKK